MLQAIERALGSEKKWKGARVVASACHLGRSFVLVEVSGAQGRLSARERETTLLPAKARQNKAIAKMLGFRETTVAAYIRRVYKKLRVSSRAELASYGLGLNND